MAKVLFAQHVYYPYQSVMRLSAYLKDKGHLADLVIGDENKIANCAQKTLPDLVAFSVLTPDRNRMLSAVTAIKALGIPAPVIAGGYDITFLPEILEYSPLDIICRGEGEEALVELCDRIDAKRDYSDLGNLWVKKEGKIRRNPMRPWITDRDRLPFDDRELYPSYDNFFKIVPFTSVMAGRGCPYRCSYCFNDQYKEVYRSEGSTGYCSLRSVDNVIQELVILRDRYRAKYIFFNDSTLTYNKPWLHAFLKEYKRKVCLPFSINAVISEVDEEVGSALQECGYCFLVRFGLETGNEELRMRVLNKKVTNRQLIEGTRILQKYKVKYSMTIMMALPGETMEAAWETIEMAGTLLSKGNTCSIAVFQAYPGLGVTDYGITIGQYRAEDVSVKGQVEHLKKRGGRPFDGEGSTQVSGSRYGHPGDAPRLQFGTETYRIDPEGEKIKKLFRFSHLAIRHRWLRPLISLLIELPDNLLYRGIFHVTQLAYATWPTAHASSGFVLRYLVFHFRKRLF